MSLIRFIEDFIVTLVVVAGSLLLAIIITALILSPGKKKEAPKKYDSSESSLIKLSYSELKHNKPFAILKIDTTKLKEAAKDIEEYAKKMADYAKKRTINTTILKILTHEGGYDQTICNLVAQALYNACVKYNWQYSPLEIMYKYQYAKPLTWYSKEAENAYISVFINGVNFPQIKDATIFYAPAYCTSPYHESQIFVYEVNGVRFFKERR